MRKAVLWDYGGVIATGPFEQFNAYEVRHGLPTDFIRRVNSTNPDHNAWAKLERSEIETKVHAEYDERFAQLVLPGLFLLLAEIVLLGTRLRRLP